MQTAWHVSIWRVLPVSLPFSTWIYFINFHWIEWCDLSSLEFLKICSIFLESLKTIRKLCLFTIMPMRSVVSFIYGCLYLLRFAMSVYLSSCFYMLIVSFLFFCRVHSVVKLISSDLGLLWSFFCERWLIYALCTKELCIMIADYFYTARDSPCKYLSVYVAFSPNSRLSTFLVTNIEGREFTIFFCVHGEDIGRFPARTQWIISFLFNIDKQEGWKGWRIFCLAGKRPLKCWALRKIKNFWSSG